MKKKSIIVVSVILFVLIGYYFGIQYLVFETGRGIMPHKLELKIPNTPIAHKKGVVFEITHQYPLVNFLDSNVWVQGIVSNKTYHYGSISNGIKLPNFPYKEPLRIVLERKKYFYVYGSQAGTKQNLKGAKKVKITLFSMYNKEYQGWYKMEKIK